MRQSGYLRVDVLLDTGVAELAQLKQGEPQEVSCFSHELTVEISSTNQGILFNTLLFPVHKRVISCTIHLFLDHSLCVSDRFSHPCQGLGEVIKGVNFLRRCSRF